MTADDDGRPRSVGAGLFCLLAVTVLVAVGQPPSEAQAIDVHAPATASR